MPGTSSRPTMRRADTRTSQQRGSDVKVVSLPGGKEPEGFNWFATGALFSEAAAFIMQRVQDEHARAEVVGSMQSGYVFWEDLPEPDLTGVLTALRDEFPSFVDSVVYPPQAALAMDHPEIFIARAKSLAYLAGRSLTLRDTPGAAPPESGGQVEEVSARVAAGVPLRGHARYEAPGGIDFHCAAEDRAEKLARAGSDGSVSVCIGTLRLETGVTTHQLLYARGYSPRSAWGASSLPAPDAAPGAVFLLPERTLVPGAPVEVAGGEQWGADYDARTGWLRVGARRGRSGDLVRVADDTVVEVVDGFLASVWLYLPSA
ncbi:hypothetical protein JS756_27555 [Streptomyces actuosus]|uniref:Uncharacterized protein n=1 Tax=Streptomyces actuosus TaxID=1885 RepID=A0ABS2VXB8_STRAS|nr:hypothetical protein [Streptomyces actuosus]MBN0047800.1 hypothetical protein [Streptomyces actuosus]